MTKNLFMLRSFLNIILCFLIPATLSGQRPAAGAALLHINQPFYVTGEVIWYQLYLPPERQGEEFTIKAAILDEQGQPVDESFIRSGGQAVCQGYYAIPYHLPSGVYRLWLTALGEDDITRTLAMAAIPAYNDLQPLPEGMTLAEAPASAPPPESSLKVELALETPGPISPRQPLQLRIKVQDASGQAVDARASVTVRDEHLYGKKALDGPTLFTGPPCPDEQRYRAGINWPGVVTGEGGQPLNSPLLGVVGVDGGRLLFTRSDGQGKFLLRLPEYTGPQRWQFIDHAAPALSVRWERPEPPPANRALVYTEGIVNYLAYSRQRKKIYQFYAALETALSASIPPPAGQTEGWAPDISYIVPNYERFPNLAAFFQEAVPAVRFLPRAGGYSVSLYNPESQDYFSAPPLFLIDGKATRDAGFAGGLDPVNVKLIELLWNPRLLRQHFPSLGAGGLIRITTALPGLQLPPEQEEDIFNLPGLQPGAAFPAQDEEAAMPALRPAVFWSPGLHIEGQEGATLVFRHSEDYGEFCIEAVVQSQDGRRGMGRLFYTVNR